MISPPAGSKPILCAPILRKVDAELILLLRSLAAAEWDLQTVAPQWRVRDVAAHMLDTALRKLSMVRDGWFAERAEISSPEEVVAPVNRLNREGVLVYRRLSSSVLIELLQTACTQSAVFHESLDPFAPALFNVSWAGEAESLNWFDTARELTERWHHQQQIRLATGRPGILNRDFYYPVLDCFLRGLPHVFRSIEAEQNSTLEIEIAGASGGYWYLIKQDAGWLFGPPSASPTARVRIPEEIAWRVFTKGIDRSEARERMDFEGDLHLAETVLRLTAIVG